RRQQDRLIVRELHVEEILAAQVQPRSPRRLGDQQVHHGVVRRHGSPGVVPYPLAAGVDRLQVYHGPGASRSVPAQVHPERMRGCEIGLPAGGRLRISLGAVQVTVECASDDGLGPVDRLQRSREDPRWPGHVDEYEAARTIPGEWNQPYWAGDLAEG